MIVFLAQKAHIVAQAPINLLLVWLDFFVRTQLLISYTALQVVTALLAHPYLWLVPLAKVVLQDHLRLIIARSDLIAQEFPHILIFVT
jgi:hypothetical protein